MKELIELLDYLWDTIEANQTLSKRPQFLYEPIIDNETTSTAKLGNFPVSQQLETSLTAAERCGFKKLADLVRQTIDMLTWSQNPAYTKEKLGINFINNYVFGAATGPDSFLSPKAPPSGFLLLGPNTEYPSHSHPPSEIYMVLTPGAQWQLDGKKWFSVSPGEIIFHSPNQPHAMRTHKDPMLAFAAWLESGIRTAISI